MGGVIGATIVLTILGTILTTIVMTIIKAIRTQSDEPPRLIEDEGDKMISLRGDRVAYILPAAIAGKDNPLSYSVRDG